MILAKILAMRKVAKFYIGLDVEYIVGSSGVRGFIVVKAEDIAGKIPGDFLNIAVTPSDLERDP